MLLPKLLFSCFAVVPLSASGLETYSIAAQGKLEPPVRKRKTLGNSNSRIDDFLDTEENLQTEDALAPTDKETDVDVGVEMDTSGTWTMDAKRKFWNVDATTYNASAADPGSVLFVVKAFSGKNFKKYMKLSALMKTWGVELADRPHIIVGDQHSYDFPDLLSAPQCEGTGGRYRGLPCRVAFALSLAAKRPSNWSWLYMVDDDHYVVPRNVEQFLAHHDASERQVMGCFGCGKERGFCNGKGGFCGGCGIAFSRAGLEAMVLENGETTAFEQEHQAACRNRSLTRGIDDVTTGCVMLNRVPDMQISPVQHVEPNREPRNLSTVGPNTPMLAWHHVSTRGMYLLDEKVRGAELPWVVQQFNRQPK
jgi:hypothetical protein